MCDKKYGQQINEKFFIKLKKNQTKCYKSLREAYGENFLSCVCIFERYKQFSRGREITNDDQHLGRSISVSALQTATKINEIVYGDRCMSIRVIVEILNSNKETARKIFRDELNMKEVCAKLVPKNLTPGQKLV